MDTLTLSTFSVPQQIENAKSNISRNAVSAPNVKKETKEKQITETELELQLPQIEGISEKQINYAKSLRYEVAHKNMDTINSFREQISTCGHTISEIAEVAVKKPHSRLAIGYFCCIETNASKIIDAFK